jgi:hypothetical protein
MRFRPVRPNIYLPVVRFGVVVADWKYILCATLTGYLIPFFFRLKIGSVPLWFVTGIGAAAFSYAFFRYTKVGRRAYWFQHSIKALLDGEVARRTLPADRNRRPLRDWIFVSESPTASQYLDRHSVTSEVDLVTNRRGV